MKWMRGLINSILNQYMNYTITTSFVKSQAHPAYPNGSLTAAANVNYNRGANPSFNPIKLRDIVVTNDNGASLFNRDAETSVNAIRAIAKGLLEIADIAEAAHEKMNEMNKTS